MSYTPLFKKTQNIVKTIVKVSKWWNSKDVQDKVNDKATRNEYEQKFKNAKKYINVDIDDAISDVKQSIRRLEIEIDYLKKLKNITNKDLEYAALHIRG
jgi:hypothetical protein